MSHRPNMIWIMRFAVVSRTLRSLLSFSLPLVVAIPALAGPAERLSISVTNKYGDVFTNLTVARILGDGLLLEHKAGQLKVKYEDLPPAVRQKYQPLAAAAVKREQRAAVANAAFLANQANIIASRKTSAPASGDWKIDVPGQDWKLVIFNPGIKAMYTLTNEDSFACRSVPGENGCNVAIAIEKAPTERAANEDVARFFWSQDGRNPLIDRGSVKVERKQNFVKVSYTVVGTHNVNCYFAFKDRWINVQLSKSPFNEDDQKLFDDFEDRLRCEE